MMTVQIQSVCAADFHAVYSGFLKQFERRALVCCRLFYRIGKRGVREFFSTHGNLCYIGCSRGADAKHAKHGEHHAKCQNAYENFFHQVILPNVKINLLKCQSR